MEFTLRINFTSLSTSKSTPKVHFKNILQLRKIECQACMKQRKQLIN